MSYNFYISTSIKTLFLCSSRRSFCLDAGFSGAACVSGIWDSLEASVTKCRHSFSPRSEEAGLESSNPEPTWRQMRVLSSSIVQLFYRQPKPRFLGAVEASRILAKYPDRVPVICATWLLAFRGLKAPTKPSPCETSCQPFQGLGFKGLWVSRSSWRSAGASAWRAQNLLRPYDVF